MDLIEQDRAAAEINVDPLPLVQNQDANPSFPSELDTSKDQSLSHSTYTLQTQLDKGKEDGKDKERRMACPVSLGKDRTELILQKV